MKKNYRYLALMILFLPLVTYASSSLKCTGIVSIKSVHNIAADFINTDIDIHEHTFICKGHDTSIPEGLLKNKRLYFKGTPPHKNKHYLVNYEYHGGRTDTGFTSHAAWKIIREIKKIPIEKRTKILPSKKLKTKIPKIPSEGIDLYRQTQTITSLKEVHKLYVTNIFTISYPKKFTVSTRGENSAYFLSPSHNDVTFYIYTQQEAKNTNSQYEKVKHHEEKLSTKSERSVNDLNYYNYTLTKWVTIKDKDNTYYRSYISQQQCNTRGKYFYEDCVYSIIGIRYISTKAYNKYMDKFMIFKDSLSYLKSKLKN